eukprot:2347612-Pyramimonas_sp.AAC.1
MRAVLAGASAGPPYGATQRCAGWGWGRCGGLVKPGRGQHSLREGRTTLMGQPSPDGRAPPCLLWRRGADIPCSSSGH